MAKKLISYNDTKPGLGLPDVVEAKINALYTTKSELQSAINGIDRVVSPSVARLLTYRSGDVAPATAPGDLLIEYLASQQFFSDFTGGITADWDQEIQPGPWVVVDDDTARDGKALILQQPFDYGPRLLSFTPAESGIGVGEQVEILARVKGNYTANNLNAGIATRMSGVVGSVSGLALGVYAGELRLSQFTNGSSRPWATPFVPPTDAWIMLRLRVTGNQVYAKGWVADQAEPAEWMITTTTTATPGGMTGLYSWLNVSQRWDWVGIATGNEVAPSEALT